MVSQSPGVAGVPKPGAMAGAWPKPPKPLKPWEGAVCAGLCPKPEGAPNPPKGDAAGAAVLPALCPKAPKPSEAAALAVLACARAAEGAAVGWAAGAAPKTGAAAVGATDMTGPYVEAKALLEAGVVLRPKESPFPNGDAAAAGAAEACCPSPPKAPKPVITQQHQLEHMTSEGLHQLQSTCSDQSHPLQHNKYAQPHARPVECIRGVILAPEEFTLRGGQASPAARASAG